MNFKDEIPSFRIDFFKDYFVLVFDLTSMQDVTEKCRNAKLLRLELNFYLALEHVAESFVFGERLSSVAIETFGVVERKI